LKVNGVCTTGGRRKVDHQVALRVLLTLSEVSTRSRDGEDARPRHNETKVHVHVKPVRNRDRRNRGLKLCVDQLVISLRSYLMGQIIASDD
jgi:hypothetical protein